MRERTLERSREARADGIDRENGFARDEGGMNVRPPRVLVNLRVALIVGGWALLGPDSVILWLLAADYAAWLCTYPERQSDPGVFRACPKSDRLFEFVPRNRFNFYFGSRLVRKKFRKVKNRINGLGFRGAEISERTEGVFRILALGDSSTFGSGVEEAETFVRIVEETFNRQGGLSLPVEIVNLAVDGYNTRQEVALYRQFREAIDHDMVWMFTALDDAFVSGLVQVRDDGTLYRPGAPIRLKIRNALAMTSGLVWWLHDAYRFLRAPSHFQQMWDVSRYGYSD